MRPIGVRKLLRQVVQERHPEILPLACTGARDIGGKILRRHGQASSTSSASAVDAVIARAAAIIIRRFLLS
jgi:hypothetical protein